MKHWILSIPLLALLLFSNYMQGQGSPDYTGGLKVTFDENENKYLRIITWGQAQLNMNLDAPDDQSALGMQLRRARVLMFSQISPKFLILTHFGTNSVNANNLAPVGRGGGAELFMHDMWVQYNISEELSLGAGLHYFNGISRLNNQSTLNILTLDNNRASWATIGLSDQFARHMGVFAKGKLGKLQYQLAWNEANTTTLDTRLEGKALYQGRRILGSKDAGKNYAGYFSYNFLDQESNFLPFKVGSYLGGKRVFNIGGGFFFHPNGVVENLTEGQTVTLMALDAFYDSPVGESGAALTAYAVAQFNDYGDDFLLGPYGSGTMLYGHIGYVLPGEKEKTRFQPYLSFMNNSFDAGSSRNILGVGVNAYISGHNAKLTLEFNNSSFDDNSASAINLQAMIYL